MNPPLDTELDRLFSASRHLQPTEHEVQATVDRLGSTPSTARSTRRRRTVAAMAVAGAVLAAAGAVAVTVSNDEELDRRIDRQGALSSSGDPALDRLVERARTKRSLAPVADTFSIEARASDPRGGPPWALVVWRTQTGGYCSFPGRERGGEIGVISSAGGFAPFPFHEGGSCTAARLPSGASTFSVQSNPGGPTVVHGVAGTEVEELEVSGIPGIRTLSPSDRGGFMQVVDADIRQPDFEVMLRLRNGSLRSLTDAP